jgi:hypothetical protein
MKDEYERERSKEGPGEKAHRVVIAICLLTADISCEDPGIAMPGGSVPSSLVFPLRG